MLERRPREPRVVDAEDERARSDRGEPAELRVVAVHGQGRVRWKPLDRRAPALGDELELAVAVELVAEEVAEGQRPRLHALARPPAARASSTSNRPSSASREASSVEATPDTRFAPEALCARA